MCVDLRHIPFLLLAFRPAMQDFFRAVMQFRTEIRIRSSFEGEQVSEPLFGESLKQGLHNRLLFRNFENPRSRHAP